VNAIAPSPALQLGRLDDPTAQDIDAIDQCQVVLHNFIRAMLRGNDLASGQDLANQPPGVRRTQWFSIPEGDHIDD